MAKGYFRVEAFVHEDVAKGILQMNEDLGLNKRYVASLCLALGWRVLQETDRKMGDHYPLGLAGELAELVQGSVLVGDER